MTIPTQTSAAVLGFARPGTVMALGAADARVALVALSLVVLITGHGAGDL